MWTYFEILNSYKWILQSTFSRTSPWKHHWHDTKRHFTITLKVPLTFPWGSRNVDSLKER